MLGQIAGIFFNNTVITNLNSLSFCNSYIYNEIKEVPVLTMQNYIILLALVFFVSSFLLLFYQEKQEELDDGIKNIMLLTKFTFYLI